ncbi:hypothetical protein DERF_014185 [Dermatophagoides farinae]|uniref:Uncharacterized protein n=1 Tax=Dermatophagoides farinae TaxID=6954 RepID=A0A922HLL0_DERFA|nr:hypothetical protein DERF_014185 [Dermatophagoides farinae]
MILYLYNLRYVLHVITIYIPLPNKCVQINHHFQKIHRLVVSAINRDVGDAIVIKSKLSSTFLLAEECKTAFRFNSIKPDTDDIDKSNNGDDND